MRFSPNFLLLILGLLLAACSTTPPEGRILTEIPVTLTEQQREALLQSLAEKEKQYNPATHMLRTYNPPTANHYHTNLIDTHVHAFRSAAGYALELLDSNLPENTERSIAVLENLLRHQDQDSTRKTYGIWPYYLEEPLDQMPVPDWNWADFIGSNLIEITLAHQHKLPPALNDKIGQSIRHAAGAIKRRDVKPSYTNIAIMGTFVTYMAAELYDWPEMREYANFRLKRFYDYSKDLKGFEEYNSPTYTLIALDELMRLKKCVTEPEAKRMLEELYHLGWASLANHWHAPSAQLAGPHSRSYSDVLRPGFYATLYSASNGAVAINGAGPALNAYRLPHQIPADLLPFFTAAPEERFRTDTFAVANDGARVVGSTLITADFSLGSVNHCSMWQQRRPLLAYWGTPAQPGFFQVKFLHDFVEYASANISSVQQGNQVLSGVQFVTDAGDYHIHLDRINGSIQAKDLRLRFEFGDSSLVSSLKPDRKNTLKLKSGNTDLEMQLEVLHAVFDKYPGHFEVGAGKGKAYLDWVAYAGPEATIDFTRMQEAAVGFALTIGSARHPAQGNVADARARREGDQLSLAWGNLALSLPVKPGPNPEVFKWK